MPGAKLTVRRQHPRTGHRRAGPAESRPRPPDAGRPAHPRCRPTPVGSTAAPRQGPAKATIVDMAWLADVWLLEQPAYSIDECWTPPGGGAMLGVSRAI